VDGIDIKIARIKAGVRAYELAHRVGLSESALSRIETGRKRPTPELVARITDALSVAGPPVGGPGPRPAA
jgi:transcriptional regulator with XRE-family HTH domain